MFSNNVRFWGIIGFVGLLLVIGIVLAIVLTRPKKQTSKASAEEKKTQQPQQQPTDNQQPQQKPTDGGQQQPQQKPADNKISGKEIYIKSVQGSGDKHFLSDDPKMVKGNADNIKWTINSDGHILSQKNGDKNCLSSKRAYSANSGSKPSMKTSADCTAWHFYDMKGNHILSNELEFDTLYFIAVQNDQNKNGFLSANLAGNQAPSIQENSAKNVGGETISDFTNTAPAVQWFFTRNK